MQVMLSHGRLRQLNKILFLEDDLLFGETLVDLLEEESFEVNSGTTSASSIEFIRIYSATCPSVDSKMELNEIELVT